MCHLSCAYNGSVGMKFSHGGVMAKTSIRRLQSDFVENPDPDGCNARNITKFHCLPYPVRRTLFFVRLNYNFFKKGFFFAVFPEDLDGLSMIDNRKLNGHKVNGGSERPIDVCIVPPHGGPVIVFPVSVNEMTGASMPPLGMVFGRDRAICKLNETPFGQTS